MSLLDRMMPNRRRRRRAEAGYAAVVAQARQPVFYRSLDVPDTLDGRFEMVLLHLFLLLERLRGEPPPAEDYARALLELLVQDCDRTLRELGVGDLSVGRKVKQMAAAFYGRANAYGTALRDDEAALQASLRRNVYGTVDSVPETSVRTLAAYLRAAAGRLEGQPVAALLDGAAPCFGDPPAAAKAVDREGGCP